MAASLTGKRLCPPHWGLQQLLALSLPAHALPRPCCAPVGPLPQELAEYKAESQELKNQNFTIRKLEETVRELEAQLEEKASAAPGRQLDTQGAREAGSSPRRVLAKQGARHTGCFCVARRSGMEAVFRAHKPWSWQAATGTS